MRNEFKISPLAVVHGGLGSLGLWELPESTKTILCPRDRLMLLRERSLTVSFLFF